MASLDGGCAFCGADQKVKLQKCSRCKSVCYCSKECQRSHWKKHKAVCKPGNVTPKKPESEVNSKPEPPSNKSQAQKLETPITQPISKDYSHLADFVISELDKNGYCVFDDLLVDNTANELLKEVKSLYQSGIFKDGQLSGGVTASDNKKKYTEKAIRSDMLTWVEGHEPGVAYIGELLHCYDSIVKACNLNNHRLGGYDIQGRTKAMVTCYPGSGTHYGYHVDNPDGDGRCLTVILYLNKHWTESDGGKLRIYRDGYHIDVEPLFNRVLLFWSDCRNPHEVLPSKSQRFAITVWYFDQEERRQAKELQKYKQMGEFGVEVALKDVEVKKMERDVVKMKLDEESEEAVKKMLSEDELDALAVLMRQAKDPSEFFTRYGIAPSIQGALARVLERRNVDD